MFDDLREMSSESALLDESAEPGYEDFEETPGSGRFLGLTAGQRFILALMALAVVIVMGAMCLLVTEKVWLVF